MINLGIRTGYRGVRIFDIWVKLVVLCKINKKDFKFGLKDLDLNQK